MGCDAEMIGVERSPVKVCIYGDILIFLVYRIPGVESLHMKLHTHQHPNRIVVGYELGDVWRQPVVW